jgi:tripartite-type tricarboxylate transporter receptor subunit TctC
MDRRHFLRTALATTSAVAGARAWAQGADASYPNRMVTLVVPFSAGSMTDILARSVAEKLQERWKQNVVVENRPGIAGTAGAAKAAPDGYTVMLTSNGHTVTKAVNPNVAFDPLKDFVAVTPVASTP